MKNLSFRSYLDNWCLDYQTRLNAVALFQPTVCLSEWQQRRYAGAFQNFRGRFLETVVLPMYRAATDQALPLALKNTLIRGLDAPLSDELGLSTKDGRPYDQLYCEFAKSLGVDADAALWDDAQYLECIRLYNRSIRGEIVSSVGRGMRHAVGALTIYWLLERLDEFDYQLQLEFCSRFSPIRELPQGARGLALKFFEVHASLLDAHFDATPDVPDELWPQFENEIREASNLLLTIHHQMYVGLSAYVLENTQSVNSYAPFATSLQLSENVTTALH